MPHQHLKGIVSGMFTQYWALKQLLLYHKSCPVLTQ